MRYYTGSNFSLRMMSIPCMNDVHSLQNDVHSLHTVAMRFLLSAPTHGDDIDISAGFVGPILCAKGTLETREMVY